MNSSADSQNGTAGNRSSSPFPEWSGGSGGNWSVVFCPVFEGDGTDEDDYNLLFEFITYGVLLNVIGLFGILGNVISMVILSRPQMKSSINYLLIGLARCDTVLIVTSILLFGLPVVYPATGHLFNYYFKVYPLIAPVVYPIAMVSQTVSVYLTLTVTLERFVAVCHPLRARSLCTYGRARAYVVATIAFAILYNVTRFLEVRVQKCMHTGYNQYVYQVYPSDLRNDRDYISVYIHWMYLLIMYFIPFGSLAVLNAAIYRQPEDVCGTSSKHRQTHQLKIWEGHNVHEDPKNAESYEIEKREVIITVNNFITKLYVDSQRFKKKLNDDYATGEKYEEMEDLMDRVEIAHDLITRLRQLLTMEKTDSVMDHSLNRTRFFKMDDDYKTQNEERENVRQKALVEKRRRVQLFSETIDSVTERYNSVVETINAPNDFKFLDEFKTNTIPLELKKNMTKKKRDTKNEGHSNKEAGPVLWSPFEILNGRIVDSDVKPTYRIIGTDVTSYKTVYNYSCTLYGLYVEGKGSKKEKAKEDAATEMIRQILNEQNAKTLPNQFKPFNEQEINDLQDLLKTKQNYTEFLEETTKEDIPLPLKIKSNVRRT